MTHTGSRLDRPIPDNDQHIVVDTIPADGSTAHSISIPRVPPFSEVADGHTKRPVVKSWERIEVLSRFWISNERGMP